MQQMLYELIILASALMIMLSIALHRYQILLKASPEERAGLRYAWGFALASLCFGLLGRLTIPPNGMILRFESLLLGGFLVLQMVRAIDNARRFGARNRLLLWLMLAISAFFFTIEVVNAVWFSESRLYLYGLLWIASLGALQLAAVMMDAYAQMPQTFRPCSVFLRRLRRQRMPSDRAAGHSDRASQPHTHIDNHRLPYH